jgi:hypothetical protein
MVVNERSARSFERLSSTLKKMRKWERNWRCSGSRRSLLRILQLIFELYRTLRALDLVRAGVVRIAKLSGIRCRPRAHPLRTIIDAVTKADRRTKSRWTRALRFAWKERRSYDSLEECFHENGGIAGCADKWTELRAAERTPSGFVRVGGENRVPKIPLFIGVELLDADGCYHGEKLR